MAEITNETIELLANLCRIQCDAATRERLRGDLSQILEYITQLEELDTEGVERCDSVLTGHVNVMRDDVVGDTLARDTFLDLAADHTDQLVRVPPILKGKGGS